MALIACGQDQYPLQLSAASRKISPPVNAWYHLRIWVCWRGTPTLWLKGWHSSPSSPLGAHILRPLSQRLTAQQRPKPHCTSLSQACRIDAEGGGDEKEGWKRRLLLMPANYFYFVSMLILTFSHADTVRPFYPWSVIPVIYLQMNTNQRSKIISCYFSSGQSGGGCGLLPL